MNKTQRQRLTRCVPLLAAMLMLAGVVSFASGPADSLIPKAPTVTAAPAAPVTLVPGKPAKVDLAFRVETGFHINSNTPRSDLLLPTVLRFQPPANMALSKVSYPPGQDLSFAFLPGEKLNVYTGDFIVAATVTAGPSLAPGSYRVPGTLRYQACDNRQCYAPKEIPISFDVNVVRPGKK
jgi:hypothetical protein